MVPPVFGAARIDEVLGAVPYVGWSPIGAAASLSGAQRMARRLVEAAPVGDDVKDRSYWQNQAERVVWPMLHAANFGGYTMEDVVRWVVLDDQPMRDTTPVLGEERANTLAEVGRVLRGFRRLVVAVPRSS